jgi:transcriptional regulator with XRE-family HTH domain
MLILVMNMNQRLKDLREDHDLSQEKLGQAIGVPQRTYSYYENGKRMIPPEILCRLADFYHTSVDYLLGRTDQKDPYPKK